jgi:hypothetical protein
MSTKREDGNDRTCRFRAVDLTRRCNHVGFDGLGSSVQSGLGNRPYSLRNRPGYSGFAGTRDGGRELLLPLLGAWKLSP